MYQIDCHQNSNNVPELIAKNFKHISQDQILVCSSRMYQINKRIFHIAVLTKNKKGIRLTNFQFAETNYKTVSNWIREANYILFPDRDQKEISLIKTSTL